MKINVDSNPLKKVLSFGGNGMIGSSTLSRLIETGEYEITLVSRGSWDYDTATVIKPFVQFIECDRQYGLENCPSLLSDIFQTDEYHAVLDFSGFYPAWIENAIDVLQDTRVRVYIYVSTDSVYEVCDDGMPLEKGKKLLELDAVRPDEDELREELNARDEYGDEKLEGEEVLVEQGLEDGGGFPYVFLRYADVIGPRDGTDRFITLVLWAKLLQMSEDTTHIIPQLHIPSNVLESASVTYVEDAAQSILLAMNTPTSWNQAYNIASKEVFNVTHAVEIIARHVRKEGTPNVIRMHPDKAIAMYPSVSRGPMDISKAIQTLKFFPTPLEEAIHTTVDWFLHLLESDLEYRDEMIHVWEDNLLEAAPDLFSEGMRNDIMDFIWLLIGNEEEQEEDEL